MVWAEFMKHFANEDFAALRAAFIAGVDSKGVRGRIGLEEFIAAMQRLTFARHGAAEAAAKGFTRGALISCFHQIDFHDKKTISWDEFSMFLIDDVLRIRLPNGEDPGNMHNYHLRSIIQQDPFGKARDVKYVPAWDKVLRVTSFAGQHGVELVHPATMEPWKSSPVLDAPVVAAECIPTHNVVVTACADVSCTFWGTQCLVEETAANQLFFHKRFGMRETVSTTLCLLWHPTAKTLYSGTRSGEVVRWTVNTEKSNLADRYRIASSQRSHSEGGGGVACMLPWDSSVVTAGMDCGITLMDCATDEVTQRLVGHKQGVLAMARNHFASLLISAGFEHEPLVWIPGLQGFKPWRLIDKANGHRADIRFVHSPFNTPQVITADQMGFVKIWDIRNFQCVQTIQTAHRHRRFSSDTRDDRETNIFYTTYNSTTSSVVVCGPRCTKILRGDLPRHLDSADDKPVVTAAHNYCTKTFITAHGNTVKVWDEATGAIVSLFTVSEADVTALCLDPRGRKFFVGDAAGNIRGHVYATGAVYRRFGKFSSAVQDLCYVAFRSGRKYLLACAKEAELCSFEDELEEGKCFRAVQPLRLISLALAGEIGSSGGAPMPSLVEPTSPPSAQGKAREVELTCMCCQSKLSLCILASHNVIAVIDIGSMTTIHIFVHPHDVVVVSTLTDLPAMAVIDTSGSLSIYAVRPSMHAEKLIGKVMLRSCSEQNIAATCCTFHSNKRKLYIGDSAGNVEVWNLSDFARECGLAPACFPFHSLADGVLRKKHALPTLSETKELIVYEGTFSVHRDELQSIHVVLTPSAMVIVTASYDRKVKCWTSRFESLGELSQGRLRHPESAVDQDMVVEHYTRHKICPFRFVSAPSFVDDFAMDAFESTLVIVLLKRAVTRFRVRKAVNAGSSLSVAVPQPPTQSPEESSSSRRPTVQLQLTPSMRVDDSVAAIPPANASTWEVLTHIEHTVDAAVPRFLPLRRQSSTFASTVVLTESAFEPVRTTLTCKHPLRFGQRNRSGGMGPITIPPRPAPPNASVDPSRIGGMSVNAASVKSPRSDRRLAHGASVHQWKAVEAVNEAKLQSIAAHAQVSQQCLRNMRGAMDKYADTAMLHEMVAPVLQAPPISLPVLPKLHLPPPTKPSLCTSLSSSRFGSSSGPQQIRTARTIREVESEIVAGLFSGEGSHAHTARGSGGRGGVLAHRPLYTTRDVSTSIYNTTSMISFFADDAQL